MTSPQRVLILCKGNSCRSQMAEAIWNHLGQNKWKAYSAGSKPTGQVHPLAIESLSEIDLPVEDLRSKSVDEFTGQTFDLVVTVCDNARESCPVFPGSQNLHWPFADPADATGDREQQLRLFRQVRDQIQQRIEPFLNPALAHSDSPEFDAASSADALQLIRLALAEDIGVADLDRGVDCTTDAIVPQDAVASAAFVSRQAGRVCGTEVARLVVQQFAPAVKLQIEIADGGEVNPGETIAVLHGPAHDILTIERTCLNFMCRLSGIASLAAEFTRRVAGTQAQILDTRKTTPGWRRLEKYAVACGGGANHRMGLNDAIMIKDNHLAFYRTLVEDRQDVIPTVVKRARAWIEEHADRLPHGTSTVIQVEVDTLEQYAEALGTDCEMILLDNMSCEQLAQAVEMKQQAGASVLLEASGGVNLDTVADIAQTGVDRISIGAITHSAINFDIGLDWRHRG